MLQLLLNWLIVLGTGFGTGIIFTIVVGIIAWENPFKQMGFWFLFRLYCLFALVAVASFHDKLFVWL